MIEELIIYVGFPLFVISLGVWNILDATGVVEPSILNVAGISAAIYVAIYVIIFILAAMLIKRENKRDHNRRMEAGY